MALRSVWHRRTRRAPFGIPKGFNALMSVSPSPLSESVIVTRLRAAGCVFAEDEARLLISTARTPDELGSMVDRRIAGLPLEHVIGWAEFCGLRMAVDPGVFVPRHRTEFLVRQAAALARTTTPTRAADHSDPAAAVPVIVDLCCGSGALGAALAAALGPVELHAADIDPAAMRCARLNVAAAGGRVYQGDLFDPLPQALRGRVDVLLANVPYVPSDEVGLLPQEARVHEALAALDGGTDGLAVMRRVTAAAPHWLAPGGHLLVETSERQAEAAVEVFTRAGLIARVTEDEELYATIVIGSLPTGRPQQPFAGCGEPTPAHRTRRTPTPPPPGGVRAGR